MKNLIIEDIQRFTHDESDRKSHERRIESLNRVFNVILKEREDYNEEKSTEEPKFGL